MPQYVQAPRPRMIDPRDLLGRFQHVRQSSREGAYSALCPAHEDQTPSLSITVDPDGMILIHCHAGCTASEVLAAVGLSLADLYPDGSLYRQGFGGMRSRMGTQERWSLEDQARHEQTILDMAAGMRRRGERLSARDLAREREAWTRVRQLRGKLTPLPEDLQP